MPPPPQDPGELALVKLAISLHECTGCFEWDLKCSERVRNELKEFTPETVRRLVWDGVLDKGLEVFQVRENRGFPYTYYYKVIVPVSEFVHGLFVEMVLEDPDPDVPTVLLKNAHEQRK